MNAASSESNGGAGSGRWERSTPPSATAPASRRPSRRSGCEANGPASPCRRASPSVGVMPPERRAVDARCRLLSSLPPRRRAPAGQGTPLHRLCRAPARRGRRPSLRSGYPRTARSAGWRTRPRGPEGAAQRNRAHLLAKVDQLFSSPHLPTALLVAKPVYAFALVVYLLRQGLKVPATVSLIARDYDHLFGNAIAHYRFEGEPFTHRLSRLIIDDRPEISTAGTQLDFPPLRLSGHRRGPGALANPWVRAGGSHGPKTLTVPTAFASSGCRPTFHSLYFVTGPARYRACPVRRTSPGVSL